MKKIPHILRMLALCSLLPLMACNPNATLSGIVVDTNGEALPGVGVAVQGTEHLAVSNGLGRYTLRIPPAAVILELVKTGYAPVELQVDASAAAQIEIESVLLWPLPVRKGVFLYENHRYRECTQTDPRRYMRIESRDGKETVLDSPPLFATKRLPDLKTHANMYEVGARGETPMLIAHKLPAYDVELLRLEQVEAAIFVPRANRGANASDNDLPRDTVWVPAESVPLRAVPIDPLERTLLDLRPAYALLPGIYAVHWGAFAGYTSIDARIFLFEVVDPETEIGVVTETAEGEEESEIVLPELPPAPDISVTGGEY